MTAMTDLHPVPALTVTITRVLDPYGFGFAFRGRLDSNEKDPQEVWSCPQCSALVQTMDLSAHKSWHTRR
jgi:hypothetical protein